MKKKTFWLFAVWVSTSIKVGIGWLEPNPGNWNFFQHKKCLAVFSLTKKYFRNARLTFIKFRKVIEFLNDFCSEKGMFVLKKTLIRRAGLAFEIYVKDHISCTKFQRSAESPSFCLKLSLSWKREGGERPEEILLRKPWLNDVGNCDPGPRANSIIRPTREDCKIVKK